MEHLKAAFEAIDRAYENSIFSGAIRRLSEGYNSLIDGLSVHFIRASGGSAVLAYMNEIPDSFAGSAAAGAIMGFSEEFHRKLPRVLEGSAVCALISRFADEVQKFSITTQSFFLIFASMLSCAALLWDTLLLRVPIVLAYVLVVIEILPSAAGRLARSYSKHRDASWT